MKKTPVEENATHIWKVGFPSSKDRDEAVTEAEAMARANGIEDALLHTEIIETPEHIANNEFLVSLTFGIQE